eukprot:TRINITY_DN1090_c0_g1_i1.p1 TRINITY_DN1090_c0_g1~~TRINITY_DN1090_c0_g1_i1.p1  ORF type:complete len:306 (-),score=178.47 TRINITY_DN1090_c0_g1_i1:23-940(-)
MIANKRINILLNQILFSLNQQQEQLEFNENNNNNNNENNENKKLLNKVAIITGAGSQFGIGKASAQLFSQHGAYLIVSDIDKENVELTAKEINENGGIAIAIVADASTENGCNLIIETAIKEFGKIDIFFANAGVASLSTLENTTIENFEFIWRVNTQSAFLAIQLASKKMKQLNGLKGGSIICTASVAGLRSGAGGIDYSAAKAAVINLVQLSAVELTGTNIRVNAICPGLIETEMTKLLFDQAKKRGTTHKIGQLNPLKRAGKPQEIAKIALFLASNDSSYINGQSIIADGGLSSSLPIVIKN